VRALEMFLSPWAKSNQFSVSQRPARIVHGQSALWITGIPEKFSIELDSSIEKTFNTAERVKIVSISGGGCSRDWDNGELQRPRGTGTRQLSILVTLG
jgi:hypothetical protein